MTVSILDLPSLNFDDRRDGRSPDMIILHYTGTKTAEEARDRFVDAVPSDSIGRISPHYMIDGTGQILQFVAEEKRAWHAGKSCWQGERDINSASIGIEIWNTGHEHDFEDFLGVQIQALIDLIHDIRRRWNIPEARILGHSDVAPGRKVDPGEKFPWASLAQAGIGLMPDVQPEDDLLATQWMDQPDEIIKALHAYGYDREIESGILLQEFCRHFHPSGLGVWGFDAASCAALCSLLRQSRR